jgi:hypothetical protein
LKTGVVANLENHNILRERREILRHDAILIPFGGNLIGLKIPCCQLVFEFVELPNNSFFDLPPVMSDVDVPKA